MLNLHIWTGGSYARALCLTAAVIFGSAVSDCAQSGGKSVPADTLPTPLMADGEISPAAYELRMGVMATNLEHGSAAREGAPALNVELLFARSDASYPDPVTAFLLRPRLHIGGNLAPKGISDLYAGFTWERHIASRLFMELSLGGAVHDGPDGDNNPDSYGCAVLFREAVSLGLDLTEQLRLIATVDHISNAGLCGENQGLTNAGVRLGYRW